MWVRSGPLNDSANIMLSSYLAKRRGVCLFEQTSFQKHFYDALKETIPSVLEQRLGVESVFPLLMKLFSIMMFLPMYSCG